MRVILCPITGFGCNTYICTNDGKNVVLIDCADGAYDYCKRNNLNVVAVLITHGHFDHVGDCGKFYENGVAVYCGEKEKDFIFSDENRSIFGGVYIPQFEIFRTLRDGEELKLCGITFKVIETAGHTVGGVCYLAENCLFSGDTLFRGGIGRTDLYGGNFSQLIQSLKKLDFLDGDTAVYCGHEEPTTMDYERKHNRYVNY